MDIRDRLEALERAPKGGWYQPLGYALLGVAAGGLLAGLPLSSADGLHPWVEPVYWVAVVAVALFGGLLLRAGRDIEAQRSDSIMRVRKSLDGLLGGYQSQLDRESTP